MSYEPRILISYDDLRENEGIIETMATHKDATDQMKYIYELLKDKPVTIKECNFIIAQPELSSFSKKVRNLLIDFKIEYALFY